MSHALGIIASMKPTPFFLWWVRDEVSGKTRKTKHRMQETVALERHPEARRVEGSMVTVNLPETPDEFMASSTSAWQRDTMQPRTDVK